MKFRILLVLVLIGAALVSVTSSRAFSVPPGWSRYENQDLQLASGMAASFPCITVIWQAPGHAEGDYRAYFPNDPDLSNMTYMWPGRRYFIYCRP